MMKHILLFLAPLQVLSSMLDLYVSLISIATQGYGSEYQKEDNFGAYRAIVDEGITFVDTAEVWLNLQCTLEISLVSYVQQSESHERQR